MRFLLVLLVCAACQDNLAPPERVVNLRILAIQAEPPDGVPGTDVAIAALTVHPDTTEAVEQIWLACVSPPGAETLAPCGLAEGTPAMPPPCDQAPEGDLCAIGVGPAVNYVLPERARLGRTPEQPGIAIITTVAALTSAGGLLGCIESFQQDGVVPESCRIALKRVRVIDPSQTATANENPSIDSVTRTGDTISITASSIPEDDFFVSWFITAGEIDTFRTDGDNALENTWTEVPSGARMWVVIRDGLGGEDWIETTSP
jgi:hypothetical protein